MPIYIYSGEDIYREEEALHRLLNEHHIDKDHIIQIDGSNVRNFQIENVLIECDTFSLFDDDEKAVIVKNPFFLSAAGKESEKVKSTDSPAVKKRKENEEKKRNQRYSMLENYLKHPNPNTLLIFYCHGYHADSRKKDYKLLNNYGVKIIECKKMNEDEFQQYMVKQLNNAGLVLDQAAMQELRARVDLDTMLLHNAIIKMQLYGEKHLNKNDIQHLVSLNSEVNMFALTSAFSKGDLKGCMKAAEEMLNANYDYTVMISMLSKRLRTIYNMRCLYESGYSNEDIASRMHVKSGYVYFVLKDSKTMSSRQILTYLNELADMDQGIKQGRYQPKDVFDRFLIRNGKRQYAFTTSF